MKKPGDKLDVSGELSARDNRVGGRLARAAGRLMLWGCVLLLLVRGVSSVLAGSPHTPMRVPVVTVTQPVTNAPSDTRGR